MARSKKQQERRDYIKSRRRKQWNCPCNICEFRWHDYKWSCFHEGSNVCTGCLQYLNNIAKKGGAWIARNLIFRQSQALRLQSVVPATKKNRTVLRAVQ